MPTVLQIDIVGAFSILASIAAIVTVIISLQRKALKDAMQKGQNEERFAAMCKDIEQAFVLIHEQQEKLSEISGVIIEIKTSLQSIADALSDIKERNLALDIEARRKL